MRRFIYILTAIATIALLTPLLGAVSARADEPLLGEIRIYAGYTPPDCWAWASGQDVSRATYADLYTVLGDAYGNGDGSTTFNLPNMVGRVPVGGKIVSNATPPVVYRGDYGGEHEHTLTEAEMPLHWHLIAPHNHPLDFLYFYAPAGANQLRITAPGSGTGQTVTGWGGSTTTGTTGSGSPHNNMQPYTGVIYIIYTGVCLATPTPTPTATNTPTPTNTPTATITPTPTQTATPAPGQLSYIDAYTHTLQSNQTLLVPVSATFGQVMIAGVLICIVAVMVFDFGHRLVYRK